MFPDGALAGPPSGVVRSNGVPWAAEPGRRSEAPASGRTLGVVAAIGISLALAVMVSLGLLRRSWMPPRLTMPVHGPPFELPVHVPARPLIILLWAGGILAVIGLAAGLAAVRRASPIPARVILVVALLAVAALVVLPPVGSTDTLDYAIYGHIAVLGRSPYVFTPASYRTIAHLHSGVPVDWVKDPSYYGPLATAEQYLAAKLAGASLAVTVFWLKLVNAVAFLGVAVGAEYAWRGDRSARLRARLLWTANPLLIWSVIAAGHVDLPAAVLGMAGLLIADRPAARWPLASAAAAGLCIGLAVDLKLNYALFGLAVVIASWRRPWYFLTAGAAAAAVLVPSYVAAGTAAITDLASRAAGGLGDSFYGPIFRRLGLSLHLAVPTAIVLTLPLAWLAVRRLPAALGLPPATRIALALSFAWLLLWPHQFAWYGVMVVILLVFFPASRLDWLVLAYLSAMTLADMPGLGTVRPGVLGRALNAVQTANLGDVAPLVLLVVAVILIVFCVTGRWGLTPAWSAANGAQAGSEASDPSRKAGRGYR